MLAVIILLHKAGHEYKGGNEQGLVWTLQMCLPWCPWPVFQRVNAWPLYGMAMKERPVICALSSLPCPYIFLVGRVHIYARMSVKPACVTSCGCVLGVKWSYLENTHSGKGQWQWP